MRNTSFWRRTFLSSVFVVLGAVAALSAADDAIDAYVSGQLAPRHIPGLSLAIVRNGRVIKARGYGVASLELNVPATDRTVYELGSISKQFTAEAIMLLVEEGRLRLDDKLTEYIDHLPLGWATITLRHVLTHTAGIADFDTGNIGFSYQHEYTPREFVDLVSSRPLAFAPGSQWAYTNSFPLLGFVIERVSGVPYVEFVSSRIFKPLQMTSTRFKVSSAIEPNRAAGHVYKEGAYRLGEQPSRPAVIAPNGGIVTTVGDLAKWDIAFSERRLLRPASWEAITTPVRLNDGRIVNHGLAWFMDAFNGHHFEAHWGSTVGGFSAVVKRYVDDKVSVILMANVDDGAFGIDAISKRVADMVVPGLDVGGLKVQPDSEPQLSDRLKASLVPSPSSLAFIGEERTGNGQFLNDPRVVRIRRYRGVTAKGTVHFTFQLSADGAIVRTVVD